MAGGFFSDLIPPSLANNAGNVKGAFDSFGGAVGDFYAAKGAGASADAYFAERGEDETRAAVSRQQTRLQLYASSRKIAATQGATSAGVAGAGFQQSGTGLDLLREGAQQGYLNQAVIQEQGNITEAGYLDAAKQAEAQGVAAHSGIFGDILGGVLKAGAAAAQIAAI